MHSRTTLTSSSPAGGLGARALAIVLVTSGLFAGCSRHEIGQSGVVALLDDRHVPEVLTQTGSVSLRPTWNRGRFLSGWWPAGRKGPLTLVTGPGQTGRLELVLLDPGPHSLVVKLAPAFDTPESIEVRAGERTLQSLPGTNTLRIDLPRDLPAGPVLLELTPRGGRLAVEAARLRSTTATGNVSIEDGAIHQSGPSIVEIVRPVVSGTRLRGRFGAPRGAAEPGQTFSLTIEREDGTRDTVFRWTGSGWGRLARFRPDPRFEVPLDPVSPGDRPGFVRLRFEAAGAGPPGLWHELALLASQTEPNIQPPHSTPSESPSLVLLYVMDALRADTAWQGETVRRLAAEGRAFLEHRSTAPNTLPATKALLTGIPSVRCGGCKLPQEGPDTLGERFRDAGYATALVSGNVYVSPAYRVDRGFDHVAETPPPTDPELDPPGSYNDNAERLHAAALAWLDSLPQGQPAFLYVHALHPHNPYAPPPPMAPGTSGELASSIDGLTGTLLAVQNRRRDASAADRERLRQLYEAGFRYGDAELGRFLSELATRRPAEEQLVALTGDHGEELFDHGGVLHGYTLYDEMIRIPLVFWSPGRIAADEAYGETRAGPGLTGPLDVHATLAELVDSRPLPGEGRSLWPWLAEGSSTGKSTVDAGLEVHFAAASSLRGGIFSAQTRRWKLIHAPRTGIRWGQGSRLGRDFSPAYLFDLRSDPGERRNRIGEDDLEAAWLRSRLRAWIETHRAVENGQEAAPDPEVSRRLRALGYVG